MPDFPTKQILMEQFNQLDGETHWYFCDPILVDMEYDGTNAFLDRYELVSRKRAEAHKFIREESAGRFYIQRGSKDGYWFENPHDAIIYKLRFL